MMSCIEMLLQHNYAVRNPILDVLRKLSDDELRNKEKSLNCCSIWDLLVHLIESERYWNSILRDEEPQLPEDKYSDGFNSISVAMKESESRTREYLESLHLDALHHVKSVRWRDQTVSFTVKKALVHLATHEIHRRGLIVGLIRQLGYEPPDVNML
jgi:uncharacterized damage-inducible protein DinB